MSYSAVSFQLGTGNGLAVEEVVLALVFEGFEGGGPGGGYVTGVFVRFEGVEGFVVDEEGLGFFELEFRVEVV